MKSEGLIAPEHVIQMIRDRDQRAIMDEGRYGGVGRGRIRPKKVYPVFGCLEVRDNRIIVPAETVLKHIEIEYKGQ